jgi:hypothetical protein
MVVAGATGVCPEMGAKGKERELGTKGMSKALVVMGILVFDGRIGTCNKSEVRTEGIVPMLASTALNHADVWPVAGPPELLLVLAVGIKVNGCEGLKIGMDGEVKGKETNEKGTSGVDLNIPVKVNGAD